MERPSVLSGPSFVATDLRERKRLLTVPDPHQYTLSGTVQYTIPLAPIEQLERGIRC